MQCKGWFWSTRGKKHWEYNEVTTRSFADGAVTDITRLKGLIMLKPERLSPLYTHTLFSNVRTENFFDKFLPSNNLTITPPSPGCWPIMQNEWAYSIRFELLCHALNLQPLYSSSRKAHHRQGWEIATGHFGYTFPNPNLWRFMETERVSVGGGGWGVEGGGGISVAPPRSILFHLNRGMEVFQGTAPLMWAIYKANYTNRIITMETTSCLCVYPPCVYITDRSLSHTRTSTSTHTLTYAHICLKNKKIKKNS